MEWEFKILDALQDIQSPILTKVMAFVTMLGEAGWFWIVLGIVLLCTKKYRKCGVAVLLALILDLILANIILKPLVARPRPCWIREDIELLVRVPRDYSFPSGHTMASFASAGALLFTEKKFGVGACILALLMGISRLYFYVHFPTDVLSGVILGLLCGVVSVNLMNRMKNTKFGEFYSDGK